nr:hypothetical protein [uncultured Merdimonas sp.]
MLDLTFGEQVKIILSRRGMTIKELAETIEERTGKKMSRQNLTQRLGRDNFQEQDMRMIAEILDCPFQLSILGEDGVPTENVQGHHHIHKETSLETEKAEPKKEAPQEVHERDITIGELVDIHEELDAMIEQEQGELPPLEEPVADLLKEVAEEEEKEEESFQEEKKEEHPNKEEKKHGWRDYLLRRIRKPEGKKQEEKLQEEEPADEVPAEPETQEAEIRDPEPVAEAVTEDYVLEEEEPLIIEEEPEKMSAEEEALAELQEFTAEEEDLEKGDVNPYTGREYKSNSVRMHPTRIGYVQVYDRGTHAWTDMTEWAFLGYQERKKALLGKDYVPPIYLD